MQAELDPALDFFAPVIKLVKTEQGIMFVISRDSEPQTRSITLWFDGSAHLVGAQLVGAEGEQISKAGSQTEVEETVTLGSLERLVGACH